MGKNVFQATNKVPKEGRDLCLSDQREEEELKCLYD